MEQETILKEILHAIQLHGERTDQKLEEMEQKFDSRFEQIDRRFEQIDQRFEQMDRRFEQMDQRFDRLEIKVDGIRLDLSDTQRTSNFTLSKLAAHDEKLLKLSQENDIQ
ncbi:MULTISPECIES: hypothetical protein [unclassified Sporosarcina]|uniref:hypothetical protein n=1 Tax=unclassified Sporosarcina TaxID=2647733 RepID=UPI002040B081|nr:MULTISPECIES: hypothetical protein [unclassified Sporosarcina]GKV64822.1 hypothetical protein NCCP2331_09750 [Sporosarcina sp. NCCP-2331]GLB54932.1 hypothetical protein NCCP2378_07170 [Sporosarcina sp. NCCP-2378]